MSQSWRRTVRSSRYMVLERKSMPMVAWYVVSNVSYMKRVMMLVLPTLWSPRNTSLYRASGPLLGVAFVAILFVVFSDAHNNRTFSKENESVTHNNKSKKKEKGSFLQFPFFV